jgi:hypothetical protein
MQPFDLRISLLCMSPRGMVTVRCKTVVDLDGHCSMQHLFTGTRIRNAQLAENGLG